MAEEEHIDNHCETIQFCNDEKWVYMTQYLGAVMIWDLAARQLVHRLKGIPHDEEVWSTYGKNIW